jgi:hypothetical protein
MESRSRTVAVWSLSEPKFTGDAERGVITTLGEILAVLADADPADKAEICSQIGLRLTYQPGQRIVRA